MATVDTFSVPSIDAEAISPQFQSANGNAVAGGVGRARQLQRGGAGLIDLGGVGMDIATKLQLEDNRRVATDLDNSLSKGLRDIAFGDGTGDNPGFFSTEGQSAVDAAPAAREAASKLASDLIAKSSANPRVREMYTQQAQQRMGALDQQMAQHVGQQRKIAQEQTFTARQNEAFSNATVNFNNPTEVAKQMYIATTAAHDISALKGETPEVAGLRAQQAGSDIVKGTIMSALAQDDTTTAMALFTANKSSLVGQDLINVQKLVTEQTMTAKAQELAGVAMAKFPGNLPKQSEYIQANSQGKLEDEAISNAARNHSIIQQAQDEAYQAGRRARTAEAEAASDNAGANVKSRYMADGASPQDALARLNDDQIADPTKYSAAQWEAMRSQLNVYSQNADYVAAYKAKQAAKTQTTEAEAVATNAAGASSDPDTGQIIDPQGALDAIKAQKAEALAAIGDDPDKIDRAQKTYDEAATILKTQIATQNAVADQAWQEAQRAQSLIDQQRKQDLQDASKSITQFISANPGASTGDWIKATIPAQDGQRLIDAFNASQELQTGSERFAQAQAQGKSYADVTDGKTLHTLTSMKPLDLAAINPLQYQPDLTKSEFDELERQWKAANVTADKLASPTGAKTAARQMIEDFAPKAWTKTGASDEQRAKFNMLGNATAAYINDYVNANQKSPGDAELRTFITTQITKVGQLTPNTFSSGSSIRGVDKQAVLLGGNEKLFNEYLSTVAIPNDQIDPMVRRAVATYSDRSYGVKLDDLPAQVQERLAGLYAMVGASTSKQQRTAVKDQIDALLQSARVSSGSR